MSGKKDPEVTINIGLGAKASLEAKVSTEIPAQSSGRLLDALTDIIRPFSERRGLKADQIRLQREEVLVEVAQKARRRMEIENQPISPLPNKFLVPFLEKASLEELDSVLIDRWADLLASCSADPASAHPRFVQILSEMTGNDALLLHDIAFNSMDEVMHPNVAFCDCPDTYDPRYARRGQCQVGGGFRLWQAGRHDDVFEPVSRLPLPARGDRACRLALSLLQSETT